MGKALLIIVGGFSIIFTGVIFNMTGNQSRSAQAIVTQHENWIARNAAESATNVAISKIYREIDWADTLSGTLNNADYVVTATDITPDSVTWAKRIRVRAVSTFAGQTDSSIAELIQPAYSYYTFFTRSWLPSFLTYSTGDTLWGPVHNDDNSNGIRISGTPVFMSKVSSVANVFSPSSATPKCYGGAEMGASSIGAPDLTAIRAEAGAHVDAYGSNVTITFDSTGTPGTYTYVSSTSGTRTIVPNQIIRTTDGSNASVRVSGILDGQVTILSDNHIYIDDNITYEKDPLTDPAADDFLGLIARNGDVRVEKAGAIDIHASILGRGNSATTGFLRFPNKLLLTIFTVPVNIVGSVGHRNSDDPSNGLGGGYDLNILPDPRLKFRTPPYFPRITTRVEQVYRTK
jgi:hypothetical protein